MIHSQFPTVVLTGALILTMGAVVAADQNRAPQQMQEQTMDQQQIFGSQLMTQQERAEYREKLRAATSEEEREQIRAEHHARMEERAREAGVTLPEEPPAIGMRKGMEGGMGPGDGMGGGRGR